MTNPVLFNLVETLLFVGIDDNDEPLDANYSIEDFDEDCLDKLYLQFRQFIDRCEAEITAKLGEDCWGSLEDFYLGSYPDGCVERDFIFTRCGCGVGFWESGRWDSTVSDLLTCLVREFSTLESYIGDDGKVYIYF